MKKIISRLFAAGLCLALSILVVTLVCNILVECNADGRTFTQVEDLPARQYGVLLGTTPMSRYGCANEFFTHRINATVALYKAGKINRLIISGDSCSLDRCNEPLTMRDTLVARGLPSHIILLDGTGFSTIHSACNVAHTYHVSECIVISQAFHNERFIYLADAHGVDAVGYNAPDPPLVGSMMVHMREWLARVKVFVDLMK